MKASLYNHVVHRPQHSLVFNALSGALARVQPEIAERLQTGDLRGMSEADVNDMVRAGFAVGDDLCESGEYGARWRLSQQDRTTAWLAICPTLLCDMDCRYCFAKHGRDTMSSDVASGVVDLAGIMVSSGASVLAVTWFGGEPLLGMDVIGQLSDRLRSVAADAGAQYRSAMFTNGYGLDSTAVSELARLGVNSLVVPVDGPAEVHERRRPHRDGRPCWDRIMTNAVAAAEQLDVTIQCLVDEDNRAEAWSLFDELAASGRMERLRFRLGRVNCDLDLQDRRAPRSLSRTRFEQYYISGLRERLGGKGLLPRFPSLEFGCTYQRPSSLCVAPDGTLYKCLKTIGRRRWAVGVVPCPPAGLSGRLSLLESDPLCRPRCRECSLLPLCAGGCSQRLAEGFAPSCRYDADALAGWLKLVDDWPGVRP